MTLEEFKKAKLESFKQRDTDAVNAYNAIISKLMLVKIEKQANGEELTEESITACVKKIEKEVMEEIEGYKKAGRGEEVEKLSRQLETIRKYIPQMMSKEQIIAEIEKLDDKSVPNVMRYFKTNFAGKVDLRLVSETLKSM